jgi:hypothetical protein
MIQKYFWERNKNMNLVVERVTAKDNPRKLSGE